MSSPSLVTFVFEVKVHVWRVVAFSINSLCETKTEHD